MVVDLLRLISRVSSRISKLVLIGPVWFLAASHELILASVVVLLRRVDMVELDRVLRVCRLL